MMRSVTTAILLFLASAGAGFSQVPTTARMDGVVKDQQGAIVPGAQVLVIQPSTGESFRVTADAQGYWVLPSLPTGTYTVTVSHPGFKAAANANVVIDAGVPATVNTVLQVGSTTETVEVTAGATIVQTDNATVSSTLQGSQINDLPFTSHNVTELIASQPGTQNSDGVRYATINGLPQTTINITIDGINVQDNATKSNPDAVFNAVQPRTQAIEEMTMSTAAASADSTGEGAVQIKFVTKRGSNTFHGGLYETNRNSYFEACAFFNCLQGTGKDRINLNEYGFTLGGPVLKNRLFFFESFEFFDLPQSFPETGTWLTPAAASGQFSYNANGSVRTVNLYNLAAQQNPLLPAGVRPFPTAGDPTLAKTYSLIQQLIGTGTVVSRIATNNDYNRENFTWGTKAVNNRKFQAARIDYNINEKHHLNFVWNYQINDRTPDGLNLEYAILPGTGTQLGSPSLEGQYGINWTGSIGLRSVITSHITNELTGGIQGGANALGDGLSPADYGIWNGNLVSFAGYMTNPYNGNYTNYAPRSTPVYQVNDNMSYLHGNHLINVGVNFTQVNAWSASANSSLLRTLALGQATGDPDNTGATSLFTTTTLPGASATNLSDAANLYAILTGRIMSTTSSAVLGEQSRTYGPNFAVDRDHMREYSLYVQDTWHATPNLTLSLGLRWNRQGAVQNLDNLYTRPGFAGLYGVSGVGNLFMPGTLTGSAPVFSLVPSGVGGFDAGAGRFSPSVGLAYQFHNTGKFHWLTGDSAVFRAGFNISTLRQGIGFLDAVWNGNQGRSLSTSASATANPNIFPAGGVLFSDPSYPSVVPTSVVPTFPNPSFPLAVQSGQNVEDWNPQIKPEYVESWTVGFQRQLDRNTVIDVRYVANHGVGLWQAVNLNEVNILGNFGGSSFLQQFQAAQNNLAIANGISVAQLLTPGTKISVNNYGNSGLPGQVAVPILTTGIGSNTDQTTVTQLTQGVAGATANAIAISASRMAALTKAGYPINLFQVNPNNGGASTEMTNRNSSTYNSGQVEIRRRIAAGLQFQGSYAFSKSLTAANELTLRDWGGAKGPTTFDIRNGIKATWIYELPVGRGRPFLSSAHGVLGKVVSGWEIAGVGRLQSGTPINITSGRDTFNQNDGGVVLHNMTAKQLQQDVGLNFTSAIQANGVSTGTAYYLPQSLLQNTLAAFAISGTLNPSAPYIGPCTTAGQICNQVFLWGPWLSKWDVSLVKRTQIKERLNLEFRVQALNVFNHPNIMVPAGASTNGSISTQVTSSFGQTTTAFRDLNNTNDPGARSLEFVLRLNF
jgi:Carboxypeptidase regulatory-like domain/TonB dependent receptor